MKINTAQISQQIELLNNRHLDELKLFIEFLMSKKQKEIQQKNKSKSNPPKLLADLKPLAIPVSHYIIQRDSIYEDRL